MPNAAEMSPLTSVAVVCRASHPPLDGVESVVWKIEAFLEPTWWTVPRVCASATLPGMSRLLTRAAAREPPDMDPIYKRKLFTDALVTCARRGDLPIIQWLMEVYLPTGRVRTAIQETVRHGHLHVLQWLHANHRTRVVWNYGRLYDEAASSNQFGIVRWLHEHVSPIGAVDRAQAFHQAIANGDVKTAKWLVAMAGNDEYVALDFDDDICKAACRGHLEMLKWTSAQFKWSGDQSYMDAAVSGGQLEVAKWLNATKAILSVDASAIVTAVGSSDLKLIMWALTCLSVTGSDVFAKSVSKAAATGRLGVIKYLHKNCRGRCQPDAMNYAAMGGHLAVVKWLHQNRSEGCTVQAMDLAADRGHFEVVKWLHRNRFEGCTQWAMINAAANGHFKIVKWLHKHRNEGCSWRAMNAAAVSGHLAIVQWLHKHREEGCSTIAMDQAAEYGHLHVVKWLHENRTEGCTEAAMDRAAANGHLEVVKWLHGNRTEGCSVDAMDDAAENGHMDMVQWLHSNRAEGATDHAIVGAAQHGHDDIVSWFLKNYPLTNEVQTLRVAVFGGHLATAMVLRRDERVQCQLDMFRSAISGRHYESLQFLVREYADSVPGAMDCIRGLIADSFVDRSAEILDCLDELSILQES